MKPPEYALQFQSPAEWRGWLEAHQSTHKEAWLVILRSGSGRPGIYLQEAVEEALCFGWIDGVMRSATQTNYYLRFSPRKRGSVWSLSNIQRVERLVAEGRMTEAGMAKVQEARQSGEWEAAIQREDTSSLPDDLREALAGDTAAQANFEKYPASQRKMFLYWIASARTAPTRRKRIRLTVEMAAQNKRIGE